MTIYQYRNRHNNDVMDVECDRNDKTEMDATMKVLGWRPYYGSIRFGTVMHAHYDPTTGTIISDRRHFTEELARMSERTEEQTGVKTNYVEVDLHDREALGVTDDGFRETYDAGERVAGMGSKR